eukprot:3828552-Rhodomonas_salina.1
MSSTDIVYGATSTDRKHVRVCLSLAIAMLKVPLSSYASATRCPVLIWAMLLRAAYSMSGTDLAYAATQSIRHITRPDGAPTSLKVVLLRHVRC